MASNGQYGSLAAQEVDGLLSQHERYSTEDEEVVTFHSLPIEERPKNGRVVGALWGLFFLFSMATILGLARISADRQLAESASRKSRHPSFQAHTPGLGHLQSATDSGSSSSDATGPPSVYEPDRKVLIRPNGAANGAPASDGEGKRSALKGKLTEGDSPPDNKQEEEAEEAAEEESLVVRKKAKSLVHSLPRTPHMRSSQAESARRRHWEEKGKTL